MQSTIRITTFINIKEDSFNISYLRLYSEIGLSIMQYITWKMFKAQLAPI